MVAAPPSGKRKRGEINLTLPADDESGTIELKALIDRVAAELKASGAIPQEDSGLAARYLFESFGANSVGIIENGAKSVDASQSASSSEKPAQPEKPGSWTCPACGNVNYPHRTHCNMRSCGRPRPGLIPAAVPMITQMAPAVQPITQMAPPVLPKRAVKSDDLANAPAGSWICEYCGNLNYATRTHCNAHKCGRARSEGAITVTSGYTPVAQPAPAPSMPAQSTPTLVVDSDGNWTCPACGNINYPSRTKCNRRSCGLPRPAAPAAYGMLSYEAAEAAALQMMMGGQGNMWYM